MPQLFTNNGSGSLATAVNTADTTLVLGTGEGAKFPSLAGGDFALCTLTQGVGLESTWEIVKVTARVTDTLTVVRAQEGTTSASWGIGSKLELRTTAGTLAGKESTSNKDATGGYAGLTLFKLNLRNAANTVTSWFTTGATAARTWTMPDKSGTVAMTSDVHDVSAKTPVDADEMGIMDSAASWVQKKVTLANFKAFLKTYFDTLYYSLTGANPTFRNRIINGDMRIDQRNAGAAVTPGTALTYLVDRWGCYLSQASKLTFQQVVDAPPGFKFSQKITVAAQYSPTAGELFIYRQVIEGQNIVDLRFGLATAKSIIISLWVKGSVAGTYAIALQNGVGNRSYVGTVAVTSSWTQVSVALTADATGTWATDNSGGVYLSLDLGCGTNSNGTAGAWAASGAYRTSACNIFVNQTAGATLNITGVQLEPGSTATTFEQRPYDVEYALCQRYLPSRYGPTLSGLNIATTSAYVAVPFVVEARVAPTGVINSLAGALYNRAGGNYAITSCTFIAGGKAGAFIQPAAASASLTQGDGAFLYGGNYLFTGCEL